jgi:hypothetical protein
MITVYTVQVSLEIWGGLFVLVEKNNLMIKNLLRKILTFLSRFFGGKTDSKLYGINKDNPAGSQD